ncbi:hypothetical protein AB0N21_24515 [Streptomyces sp. NPDC051080]|uniref:hypothetical protein n=1 Tax=Streptomyces sp. NPDC051080 TaxID=3157222 RepID=UPI00342E6C3E
MTGLPRRRMYGSDHDDPDPYEQPVHEYVGLVGGALDGQLVDVSSWIPAARATGAMLITNDGAYGAGGRSPTTKPAPGEPGRWDWVGDTPERRSGLR